MKIIIAQHGSRHRYLVAKLLWENQLLEALYTDSSAQSMCGRLAQKMGPLASGRFRRLAAREINGVPASKVFSTDQVLWSDAIAGIAKKEASWEASERRHKVMSRVMKRWGIRHADIIYAMQDESTDFLRFAKKRNVKVVVDICVTPLAHRITQAEQKNLPGWERPISDAELESLEAGMRDNLLLADMVLCPSNVVAQGVQDFAGIPLDRISVVPYGSSFELGDNNGIPGRILFAGAAIMRKGIHILATAADQLCNASSGKYEFRVAGRAPDGIRQKEECRHLNFLGKLSKNELRQEFSAADVFVLPTLAEGLPGVLLEAMSLGVPIVTTKASGIEFEDGVNGVFVPERDATALALAIERVVADRELRDRLSASARELACGYTMEAAGKRLVQALSSLDVSKPTRETVTSD